MEKYRSNILIFCLILGIGFIFIEFPAFSYPKDTYQEKCLAPSSAFADAQTFKRAFLLDGLIQSVKDKISQAIENVKSRLPLSRDVYMITLNDFRIGNTISKFRSVKEAMVEPKTSAKEKKRGLRNITRSDRSLVKRYKGVFIGMSQVGIVNGDVLTSGLLTCSGFVAKANNGLNILGHLAPDDAYSESNSVEQFVHLVKEYNANHSNKIESIDFVFDHANAIYYPALGDENYIDNNEDFIERVERELRREKVQVSYNPNKSIQTRVIDLNKGAGIATDPKYRGIFEVRNDTIVATHYEYDNYYSIPGNRVREYLISFDHASSINKVLKQISKILSSGIEINSVKKDGNSIHLIVVDPQTGVEKHFIVNDKHKLASKKLLNRLYRHAETSV